MWFSVLVSMLGNSLDDYRMFVSAVAIAGMNTDEFVVLITLMDNTEGQNKLHADPPWVDAATGAINDDTLALFRRAIFVGFFKSVPVSNFLF